MRYISACIEQLDIAAAQLHHDSPAYRRFSLVLTDNIVELLCYNQCRHEFGWTTVADNKYSQQQKEKVLKNDFSERVNFLHGLGLLSRDEQAGQSHVNGLKNQRKLR